MEELLFDRIRMKISDAQFRVSTDSMVLADFCRIRPGGRVLDLGCGCGTLGLLLLGADETLRVSGIEIQEAAARQAQEKAEENGFSAHMHIICGDLRQAHAQIAPGTFDYVLSNPPYYPPKSGYLHAQDSLCAARSEICCPFDALCAAAARALRWGGRFFLVHKPERLVDGKVELGAGGFRGRIVLISRRKGELPGKAADALRGLLAVFHLILYSRLPCTAQFI